MTPELRAFIELFAAELEHQSDRIFRMEDPNDAAISGALSGVKVALENAVDKAKKRKEAGR